MSTKPGINLSNLIRSAFSCLIPLCLSAFPAFVHAEAGWTDYAAVTELIPTSRHYYELRLPVDKNPSGCRNTSSFYQDYGINGSDQMFSTLLTSLEAGKRVRLYVTGKCNLNGYAEFTAVGILP